MTTATETQITIAAVPFSVILDAPNANLLLRAYAEECSVPNAKPQRAIYAAMEQAEALKCFAAYSDDLLVGFCSVLIARMPHTGLLQVTGESIFADPAHRYAGTGSLLLDASEQYADSIGAILSWLPRAGSQLDKILSRRSGYSLTHSQHTRRLI